MNNSDMQTNPETNPYHLSSPFFIQTGLGASSTLVPYLFMTEKYVTWARTMQNDLNIKNKLGFIDGKIIKPTDNFNLFYASWERCNDMIIIAWIQHSISLEYRSSIAHADFALQGSGMICARDFPSKMLLTFFT